MPFNKMFAYLGDNAAQIDAPEYEAKLRESDPRLLQDDESIGEFSIARFRILRPLILYCLLLTSLLQCLPSRAVEAREETTKCSPRNAS